MGMISIRILLLDMAIPSSMKPLNRKVWLEALAIFRAIESPHVSTVEKWLGDLDKES
jgi:hypothetical protein